MIVPGHKEKPAVREPLFVELGWNLSFEIKFQGQCTTHVGKLTGKKTFVSTKIDNTRNEA